MFFASTLFALALHAAVSWPVNAGPILPPRPPAAIRWVVQQESMLHIKGASNLFAFGCSSSGYNKADTIVLSDTRPDGIVLMTGLLKIPVWTFNCGNKGMTHDLRKTLNVTEHPDVTVQFIALERRPDIDFNTDAIKGWIDVSMAGVTRRFEITFTLARTGNVVRLCGERSFRFSDFHIKPPQRMGGMVKVKDAFFVDFSLLLRQLA